jgi:hypothetical protein
MKVFNGYCITFRSLITKLKDLTYNIYLFLSNNILFSGLVFLMIFEIRLPHSRFLIDILDLLALVVNAHHLLIVAAY